MDYLFGDIMRTLRIAELDFLPELDAHIGELTRVPDLTVDRYSIAAGVADGTIHPSVGQALRTPPEKGGIDFPVATLEENNEQKVQVFGLKRVIDFIKTLSPHYCPTRLIKRSDSEKMKRIKQA